MKRTFFQFKTRTLVAVFFLLGGLFFSANQAEAQSLNWMNESQALNQLNVEIDQMSLDIQNFVVGSTPYKNLANHMFYYKLIMVSIEGGLAVPNSVNENLLHINDQFDSETKMLSKTALELLYNDAVELLTI